MIELEAIYSRCVKGDKLAWEALVKETQSRIFRLAMFYVRERAEAEDLAQEIYVKMYRNLHKVQDPEKFQSWMFAIARNCCLDRIRRMKSNAQLKAAVSASGDLAEVPQEEQRYDEKRRREFLYRAMEGLSEQAREIVLLKEIQQMKISEIAKMLSLPVGTIKSRSNRARVDLAKSLHQLDPSYGTALRDKR